MSDMLSYVNDFNNSPTRNPTEKYAILYQKHRVDIFKQAYQYTAPVCYMYNVSVTGYF